MMNNERNELAAEVEEMTDRLHRLEVERMAQQSESDGTNSLLERLKNQLESVT